MLARTMLLDEPEPYPRLAPVWHNRSWLSWVKYLNTLNDGIDNMFFRVLKQLVEVIIPLKFRVGA